MRTSQEAGSGERGLHRGGGLLAHRGYPVRVPIEGYSDAAVAEQFLDELGVYAARKQEGCCRVPEVVKADGAGQTGAFEQRFEMVICEGGGTHDAAGEGLVHERAGGLLVRGRLNQRGAIGLNNSAHFSRSGYFPLPRSPLKRKGNCPLSEGIAPRPTPLRGIERNFPP